MRCDVCGNEMSALTGRFCEGSGVWWLCEECTDSVMHTINNLKRLGQDIRDAQESQEEPGSVSVDEIAQKFDKLSKDNLEWLK